MEKAVVVILGIILLYFILHFQKMERRMKASFIERVRISALRERMFRTILSKKGEEQYDAFIEFLTSDLCTCDDLISLAECLSKAQELTLCHKAILTELHKRHLVPSARREIYHQYCNLIHEQDRNYVLDFARKGVDLPLASLIEF
jgi:fumarate reductase subunit C